MRLFTAIEIPEPVRECLVHLDGDIPGAHWVDEDLYHLTLRYIGEVDPPTADDIDAALAGIAFKPFDLTVTGLGTFGTPPRVLWAGVARSDRLYGLVEKIDSALTRLKVDFQRRRYAPHVTLARLEDAPVGGVLRFVERHGDLIAPRFTVSRFVLYASERTHTGPVYSPERYYLA